MNPGKGNICRWNLQKFLLVSWLSSGQVLCPVPLESGFYCPFLSFFSQLPGSFPLVPKPSLNMSVCLRNWRHICTLKCLSAIQVIEHLDGICRGWWLLKLTSILRACRVPQSSVPSLCSVRHLRQMTPVNRTSQVTFPSCFPFLLIGWFFLLTLQRSWPTWAEDEHQCSVGWGSRLYSFRVIPHLGDNYTVYCLSHGGTLPLRRALFNFSFWLRCAALWHVWWVRVSCPLWWLPWCAASWEHLMTVVSQMPVLSENEQNNIGLMSFFRKLSLFNF